MIPTEIEDHHIDVFLLLADAVVHEVTPDVIRPYLDKDFPEDKIEEYCKTYTKPSDLPKFREEIKSLLNSNPTKSAKMFIMLMNILDSRILAPFLTGSLTLIRDMSIDERADLLRSWRDSPIASKRRLFRIFLSSTILYFIRIPPPIHEKAAGRPMTESRDLLYENQEIDPFRYTMIPPPQADNSVLSLPNIDVVVIGSGAGAGVTAHTLSNEGYKVLVLEKGKYYTPEELVFDDLTGSHALYEGGGTVASVDQQIFVLAGATFGGGTTVNWSACLKTPFKVRKEWYDDYGVEWAATDTYDQCIDYVFKQMGASTDNIKHSFTNQMLLDGSEKLGYKNSAIAQNSGGHPNHQCGFCYLGCKYGIKQGSVACWLRDAAEKGCQFMDQVKVEQIIHKRGIASGLKCVDVKTGNTFTIVGPKKFVVAGGSLQTPVLLQKSGFRNKHIGKNLKLHPVTCVTGDFGPEYKTEPHLNSIMTSVNTERDDIDGKAHGAKIETVLHAPYLSQAFLPWESSDRTRQMMLSHNRLASLLIITRDKGSGSITYDTQKPDALVLDYSVSKFDRQALLETILIAVDVLYIEGAKEIIHPHQWVPSFKSDKPKHERSIKDSDFVEWRKQVASYPLDPYGTTYGSAHQMSSCRISGKGPRYGAADLRGRLFECDNVYVADASAMPTASGANPMVTTMAIARKISLGIADDLKPKVKL